MRRSSFVVIAVVAAGSLAAGVWYATRPEPEAPLDLGTAPVVETMDPVRQRVLEHEPWPYREFERDFSAVRNPGKESDIDPVAERFANDKLAYPTKISIHVKDAPLSEVIEVIKSQLAKKIKVFTYETGELDDLRFTMDFDDKMVSEIIDELRGQSGERVKYYLTTQGLMIGSERGVQQSQIDEREDIARRRAERDREDPMLAVSFRPDFSDAWIGAIHRSIREQTGIEVVVDYETWRNGKQLTWRSEPVQLRDALAVICKELHCSYRIRDKRIYLIVP